MPRYPKGSVTDAALARRGQVFALVCDGVSEAQIAARLACSFDQVKNDCTWIKTYLRCAQHGACRRHRVLRAGGWEQVAAKLTAANPAADRLWAERAKHRRFRERHRSPQYAREQRP